MDIVVGYDPTTLREVADLRALGERLAEIGDQRSSTALNEKVVLLRLAGRNDEAWDVANAAVRTARFGGDREQLVLARIRRAQVQQAMGRTDAALVELSDCATEANAHSWESAEAMALHARGALHFEKRDYASALADLRAAQGICLRLQSSPAQLESLKFAITVTESVIEGKRP